MSEIHPQKRGLLVVVSSPSGAGKTTLCHRLMNEFPVRFSVSCTTRKARPGERDGVDYHFVTPERFQEMVDADEFAEHAVVHGNCYGTPRAEVNQALEGGRDVLFDIDWQGGMQLKARYPKDAVMIWILPPSLKVLEERLRRRATDSPEVIERRLAMAQRELAEYGIYDYLIVNDVLDRAYDELRSVYKAAHVSIDRARDHAETLVRQVREGAGLPR